MSSLMLMALSIGLLVEMTLNKLWKKSISTFILIVGFAVYFCCNNYGYTDIGEIVLAILMAFAYYRAIFKPTNEKIFTWSNK